MQSQLWGGSGRSEGLSKETVIKKCLFRYYKCSKESVKNYERMLPLSEKPGNRHFSCGGFERVKSRAEPEDLEGSQGGEELDEAGEGGRS